MNKQGLLEKHAEQQERFEKEQIENLKLIEEMPENVDCVNFVANKDTYFLYHTNTVEKHLEQLKQWESLKPELDRYSLSGGSSLSCVFVLLNGYDLVTYCSEIEKLLKYYAKDDCILESVPSTQLQLKCLKNK